MRDLRVVQARATLRVTSVAPIRNFAPASVVVLGQDFLHAEEVLYNGTQVPEFLIASETRLIARIPEGQIGRALIDIKVLASVPVTNQDAFLDLGLKAPVRTSSGIDRLVQNFLLVLMTTPGSDIFDQDSGGGAQAILGRPTSAGGQSAMADLTVAVDRTRQQVLAAQSKNPKIPLSERLASATITSLSYDDNTTTLSAMIDLRSAAGDSALVNVR